MTSVGDSVHFGENVSRLTAGSKRWLETNFSRAHTKKSFSPSGARQRQSFRLVVETHGRQNSSFSVYTTGTQTAGSFVGRPVWLLPRLKRRQGKQQKYGKSFTRRRRSSTSSGEGKTVTQVYSFCDACCHNQGTMNWKRTAEDWQSFRDRTPVLFEVGKTSL